MPDSPTLPAAPVVSLASGGHLDPALVGPYLEIEVPASAALVPFGRCTLRIVGRKLQGADVEWEYQDQLCEGHAGDSLWFYCAREVVETLRDGTSTFSYTIATPVSDDAGCAETTVQSDCLVLIVGELVAPEPLPPPEVADLVRGIVDSTLPRLLVTVPASAASLPGAMVTLTLRTDSPARVREFAQVLKTAPLALAKDVTQETKRILDSLEPVPFIFRGYPGTHDGHEVDASYRIVSPDGTTTSDSESAVFLIGTPLGLDEPFIEEGEGDVLDLDSFTGDAHIATEPHERVKEGLFYWAYIASETDGEPVFYPVKLDGQVTRDEVDRGLRIPIPRDTLDLLAPASTLRVQIAINLTGTDDPFDTVDFPEKVYTVAFAEKVSWDLEDLDPAQIPAIHVGETMSFPLMDVIFVAARISPAGNRVAVEQFAYSSPGYYSGVVFYIGAPTGTATDNVVRIEFKRRWSKARFALTSVDAPVLLTWHTASGQTLQQTIPGGSPTVGHEARCELEGIDAVTIEAKDGIRLDCFEFES